MSFTSCFVKTGDLLCHGNRDGRGWITWSRRRKLSASPWRGSKRIQEAADEIRKRGNLCSNFNPWPGMLVAYSAYFFELGAADWTIGRSTLMAAWSDRGSANA